MVVNTPSGQDARADGYAIRAATTSADKPIITTIATLAAAVLGIEAQLTEPITVTSLQDHARHLDLYGRHAAEKATVGHERPGAARHVTKEVAEVIATRRVGAYQHLTLVAPTVAELARPGQFVALAVGDESSGTLLRRSFSIHKVSPSGTYGGTVEIVVSAVGAGTRWIVGRRPHDPVDVVGPLGKAFPLPTEPVPCVLVGGGYGSAPLFWLASELRQRGCRVEMVLGAASEDRLFGVVEARRSCDGVTVTTDDGRPVTGDGSATCCPTSSTARAPASSTAADRWPCCESIARVAREHGAVAQVAVEEAMACGIGICMTCVMPVVGDDGATRMVRSCVEGPVFRGDRVRWDAFEDGHARVPDDAVGAPRVGGR